MQPQQLLLIASDGRSTGFRRGAVRQLPQLKFQSAVRAGDARSAAAAALDALEPAVKAAMANIERASAGQGMLHAESLCCDVVNAASALSWQAHPIVQRIKARTFKRQLS